MDNHAKNLILGALLHDIGKFMQRAAVPPHERYIVFSQEGVGRTGAHAKWSASFVEQYLDDPVVTDLVLYHHNPERSENQRLAVLIKKADHLSSAIDRRERYDTGAVLKEPLKAVFPRIHQKGVGSTHEERFYPLKTLEIGDEAFPVRKSDMGLWNLSDAYKDLWKRFVNDFEGINRSFPIGTVLSLLRKYTSCIPSAVYANEPDIPLYDHAKTTAALAHCLLEGNQSSPFLLIQGDVSGIQQFIFSTVIPEQARKGTAKRLRGRSFWISLLTDAIAQEIKGECGLFEPAILWNTGGRFLILAPNTGKNRERVAHISRKVNELLLRRYGGLLSCIIVAHPTNDEEIQQFARALDKLAVLTAIKKKQKFLECGIGFNPEGEERPISDFCETCGTQRTKDTCTVCDLHLEIGTKIARAQWMSRGEGLPISFNDIGLKASYDLTSEMPADDGVEVFHINDTKIPVKHPEGSGILFLGNTVPMDRRDILSFNEMSQLSSGTPRLAYLKADVDNLGKMIARGLPEKERTISRIHTISTQLQFFFAGYINRICREFLVYSNLCEACMTQKPVKRTIFLQTAEGEGTTPITYYELAKPCDSCRERYAIPKFYITYSGGDDLLIIGPWDDTIRLAERISEEFLRFTCENPAITLSAGVAIVSSRLPVARAVSIAEEHLEKAKSMEGKNRVAVFDECIPWREGTGEIGLARLISISDQLIASVEKQQISKSMVYSLLTLWEQTFRDIVTRDPVEQIEIRINRKRFLPHLKYLMKRNIEDRDRGKIEELIVPAFPWIKIPVYWTSLAMRTSRKRDIEQMIGHATLQEGQ